MTSQKKKKKYFVLLLLTIFISAEIFGVAIPITEAFSTKKRLDETMDYFGVPKDQRTFGVADRKAQAPQVRVVFSPTSPKPGEKVTATAYTSGFRDAPQDQYYTWYIRNGEESKTKVRSLDASANYTKMEQYKIDAHKLIAKKQTLDRFSAKSGPDDDGYKAHLGGHSQQRTINDYCYIYDFEDTGVMYEIDDGFKKQCNSIEKGSEDTIHLFPQPQIVGDGNFTTGDDEFLSKEEQYWGTDPNNPMSAGNGKLDEENIVGRGVDKFTWIYEEDDQVGVVVEGSAHIPTGHDDASFATMWAFLHNRCDLLGKQQTGKYTETIRGNTQRFDTIDVDREILTKCLYDNFTPVGQGGKPGAMDITLSFTPDTPSPGIVLKDTDGNDINARPTDEITVTAQIANSDKDLSQIHFTWCTLGAEYIYSGRAMPAGGEKPPEKEFFPAGRRFDQLLDCAFYPSEPSVDVTTSLQGIGQSSITFTTTTDQPYLLVRVEAGENFSSETNEIQGGYAITYIPLKNNGNTYLRSSQTKISNNKLDVSSETCADSEANNTLCRVGKNEIIGLDLSTNDSKINTSEISDLKFRIEGAGSSCIDQCANAPDKEFFFAATGETGETITIKASYTNIETEQEFTLSRTFLIVDPYIEIVPENDDMRILLGAYQYRGKSFTDVSTQTFEASDGTETTLTALIHPSLGSNEPIYWNINGTETIGETTSVSVDGVMNVSAQSTYSHDREKRKALRDHFGISQLLSTERMIHSTAQIIPALDYTGMTNSERILANISTNAPNYILFIIRTLLMISIIIFIAGFIFRIAPQHKHD